jgi:Glycosyltransferases involved in cell wall biogenesis
MKLSIITPLYNTEKHIEKCINSVINLPLPKEEYEIIVINDGSTDDSRRIVESIAAENSNLILINKENGGQSIARNIGLDMAKGNYLFFLDSDDYADGTMLCNALEYAIENDLDMLPIRCAKTDENGKTSPYYDYPPIHTVISGADMLNKYDVSGTMWQYLYKASIIKDNNLRFIETIYGEDEEFITKFMTYVNRISYKPTVSPVYYYFIRQDSIVHRKDMPYKKKLIRSMITVIDSLHDFIRQISTDTYMATGVEKKVQYLLYYVFARMYFMQFDKDSFTEILTELKEKKYYPLNINKIKYPLRIKAFLLNQKLFLKIIYSR